MIFLLYLFVVVAAMAIGRLLANIWRDQLREPRDGEGWVLTIAVTVYALLLLGLVTYLGTILVEGGFPDV